MGKVLTLFIGILMSAILVSCNTSGCTDNQNSLPLAGFYTVDDAGIERTVTIDSLDVGGVGAPGDSLLYETGTALSQIYLPFKSTAPATSFCFHYTQEAISSVAFNDTITFAYSSAPYFASEECGALFYYRISAMSYTRHVIDSIAITDSLVTNTDIERMKIFFRTTTQEQ